jgi:ABC-type uncharacterized transport system permease subunit
MKDLLEMIVAALIIGGFWGGIYGLIAYYMGKKKRK